MILREVLHKTFKTVIIMFVVQRSFSCYCARYRCMKAVIVLGIKKANNRSSSCKFICQFNASKQRSDIVCVTFYLKVLIGGKGIRDRGYPAICRAYKYGIAIRIRNGARARFQFTCKEIIEGYKPTLGYLI